MAGEWGVSKKLRWVSKNLHRVSHICYGEDKHEGSVTGGETMSPGT